MKHVSVVGLLAAQLLFSGCDTMHGLRRAASVTTSLPSAEEVSQVVASAPGVTSVKITQVPPRTYLALAYGPRKTASYSQLLVSSEKAFAVLTLGGEFGNEVSIATLWRNHRPTDTELEASAGLIDAISAVLTAHFHELLGKTGFIENRVGIPCRSAAIGSTP